MKDLTVTKSVRLGNSIDFDKLTATKDELKKQQKIESFFEVLLSIVADAPSKAEGSK